MGDCGRDCGVFGRIEGSTRPQPLLMVAVRQSITTERALSRGLPEGLALEAGQDLRKVLGIGIGLGERQPHLAHRDRQADTDLQQLEADRRALGARERTAFEPEAAQSAEQHIGEGGEVQA